MSLFNVIVCRLNSCIQGYSSPLLLRKCSPLRSLSTSDSFREIWTRSCCSSNLFNYHFLHTDDVRRNSCVLFVPQRTLRKFRGGIKDLRRVAKGRARRDLVPYPVSPVVEHEFPLDEDDYYDPSSDVEFLADEDASVIGKQKKEYIDAINNRISSNDCGRLFAVIQVAGKQFKVTSEDIIVVQGVWAPDIGDQLRFQKILLLGSKDFSVVGRPMITPDLIRIEGTVIEKTLSYTKINFILRKRKQYRRFKFSKTPYTMVRINLIEFLRPMLLPEESAMSQLNA